MLVGALCAPRSAAAYSCAADVGTGPAPISHLNINDFIVCINTEARTNAAGNAIELSTINADHYIYLNSSGVLTATGAGDVYGIFAGTGGTNSPISIGNRGDIVVNATAVGVGIAAQTNPVPDSPISIVNSGDIGVSAKNARGIAAVTRGANSAMSIANSGSITAIGNNDAIAILAATQDPTSPLSIINSGDLTATSTDNAYALMQ